jgi:hypothetical protein
MPPQTGRDTFRPLPPLSFCSLTPGLTPTTTLAAAVPRRLCIGRPDRRRGRRRRTHRRRRNLETPGGSIGSQLDNAIGYGCWNVARLLVERGAPVDALWHAAALGMLDRLEHLLAATPPPRAEDLNEAFWQACHGGKRRAAERLLGSGADINATPGYAANQTAIETAAAPETSRDLLITWLRERGASSPDEERSGP